jgi:hypothetical protein
MREDATGAVGPVLRNCLVVHVQKFREAEPGISSFIPVETGTGYLSSPKLEYDERRPLRIPERYRFIRSVGKVTSYVSTTSAKCTSIQCSKNWR